ncbi:hypothetical protein SKAU_G00271700 [Synaphobranchus kaupii]|uniref:Ig-like domain-containing protein n=1 Tax=Synaphobranchus kaupii TaxID=118154 RepID=A0A9Q1F0R5_SYNKA|nr:hypothetical protein SKAU_G00271700 [Synaphobranchus kaupii]
MDIVFLAVILLTAFGGVIAQVQLEPKNAAVLRGTDARFNCSLIQSDWVVMSWLLNGSLVLTISKEHGVLENHKRFCAINHTTSQSYKWEFVLKNTQRNESGEVTCDVQNIGRKMATLSVQENGTVTITTGNVTTTQNQPATIHCLARNWFPEPILTWTLDGINVNQDNYSTGTVASGGLFNSNSTLIILANDSAPVECQATVPALAVPETSTIFLTIVAEPADKDETVLIAVIVSVVATVLLVMLIILIVYCCCCRRRVTKSSYEEEVRKTRSLSEINSTSEVVQGKDNMAYLPDGSVRAGVVPSEFNDSGFDTDRHRPIHTLEMPDAVHNHNHEVNGHHPVPIHGPLGNKKCRHATIV